MRGDDECWKELCHGDNGCEHCSLWHWNEDAFEWDYEDCPRDEEEEGFDPMDWGLDEFVMDEEDLNEIDWEAEAQFLQEGTEEAVAGAEQSLTAAGQIFDGTIATVFEQMGTNPEQMQQDAMMTAA